MTIRVSVVVATYKRPKLLGRCLAALDTQVFDPATYEIIVANAAADDETCRLIERRIFIREGAKRLPQLRYVQVAEKDGLAAARLEGWRVARGSVIAFTDDECVPLPDWLRRGLATLDNEAEFDGTHGFFARDAIQRVDTLNQAFPISRPLTQVPRTRVAGSLGSAGRRARSFLKSYLPLGFVLLVLSLVLYRKASS